MPDRNRMLVAEALATFVLSFAGLGWIVAGADGILGVDGYYHFRVAEEIADRGPWVDIHWLPFTVLGERGPDHHWLFHLLISPFTLLGHSLGAVKGAAVFCGALIPTTLVAVGRLRGIRHAPLFALLAITASAALPGRYLMLRANGLALVFMLLALLAMTRQRHWLLGILAFLFMQFYHGALVLCVFALLWLALQWAATRSLDSRTVVALGGGLFLGLLLSPWFPENVGYLVFHTVFKMGHAYLGLVGSEWYPTSWKRFLFESWAAHLVLAAAVAGAGWLAWRGGMRRFLGSETCLFLAVALIFGCLYKSSWRFIDYYAPFVCLAAGLVLRDTRGLWARPLRVEAAVVAACVALIAAAGWESLATIERTPKTPATKYAQLVGHLERHAEPGDVVLNTHWTDFVQLIWHGPQFRYANGLDGHYLMYGEDEDRFAFWFDLGYGGDASDEDVSRLAVERFAARWIVVPRSREDVAERVRRGAWATEVHAGEDGWLFRLDGPGPAQLATPREPS